MTERYSIPATLERLQQTDRAIEQQSRYVATLTDPALKAIAASTLETLQDIRSIMQRTHRILASDDARR